MCNQFFEGNFGNAELFNVQGRKERNSFVDVIESGPERVWVRWTYFCVNMKEDSNPRLRGTGVFLRRCQRSDPPADALRVLDAERDHRLQHPAGRDSSASCPPELSSRICFHMIRRTGTATFTPCSIFTANGGAFRVLEPGRQGAGRSGDDATLAAISKSNGVALVIPFNERLLFAVLGPASGFPGRPQPACRSLHPGSRRRLRVGSRPLGPLANRLAQLTDFLLEARLAVCLQLRLDRSVLRPARQADQGLRRNYPEFCKDMDLNRWTANRVFYVLFGSAKDCDGIRRIGRAWLDQGASCARPESFRELR